MLAHLRLAAAILGGSALAMGAVLLVPFVTGSQMAPLLAARQLRQTRDLPIGSALPDFWDLSPEVLGAAIGIAVAAGVALAIVGAIRRRVSATGLTITMLTMLLGVLGIGLSLGHGEGRYLTPVMPFLFAGAGAGLALLATRRTWPVGLAAVIALLAVAPAHTVRDGFSTSDLLKARFALLRKVSNMAEREAGPSCAVITSYAAQVAWYSRCSSFVYPSALRSDDPTAARGSLATLIDEIRALPGDPRVLALLGKNGKRQPDRTGLTALEDVTDGRLLELGNPEGGPLRYFTVDIIATSRSD